MKHFRFYSADLLIVFGLILIPYNVKGQDVRITRQEKKALEQSQMNANFQAIDTLINRRTFVIEADFLENQYGNRIPVTSVLNFIMLDSSKVVLQTGSNFRTGFNGVGGVTAQGRIQDYKVDKNTKNLSYNVRFSVMTNIGIFDVLMTIYSDTNATATITGLRQGQLTWDGRFQNLYSSDVFKGQESY
jgi:Domain of unknown function (DUF4251)